ncbi:MAG: hypothetical protein IKN65_00260 [Clostridia bacterium]|nr:hypothetical protein [Bacilli bacterium]MBR3672716.1 hypothetical protein [Clostridia bacterium]MBR4671590.1 hypothetical protein [Bacilli bacterium]
MYLVYESLYGELLYECSSTNIIGLYKTKKQAIKKVKELIEYDKANNYVVDIDNNFEEDGYVTMFYNNQENWSCYYEIVIEKIELKESD